MNELKIKEYLLGQLREPELSAVEEILFTESTWSEQVLVVEDGLIDAYAANQLTSAEQQDFLRYFLVTATRRQKLQLAQDLRAFAGAQNPIVEKTPSWWTQLWTQLLHPIPAAVTALIVLGFALGGIYLLRAGNSKSTSDNIAQNTPTVVATTSHTVAPTPIKPTGKGKQTLALGAGILRSAKSAPPNNSIKLSPATATLELQIFFMKERPASVQVQVINATGKAIYQNTLAVAQTKDGSVLTVPVPTENLFSGTHRLLIVDQQNSYEWHPTFQILR